MSAAVRVLGFAGRKGAGKSTAAAAVTSALSTYDTGLLDFADPLKDMLRTLGLSDAQLYGDAKEVPLDWLDVTPRRLMQTLGTEWGRELIHPDLWVWLWEQRAREHLRRSAAHILVVADVRFANELAVVRRLGGKVAWVDRPGLERGGHVSEHSLRAGDCDGCIANVGGLAELGAAVLRFARQVGVLG